MLQSLYVTRRLLSGLITQNLNVFYILIILFALERQVFSNIDIFDYFSKDTNFNCSYFIFYIKDLCFFLKIKSKFFFLNFVYNTRMVFILFKNVLKTTFRVAISKHFFYSILTMVILYEYMVSKMRYLIKPQLNFAQLHNVLEIFKKFQLRSALTLSLLNDRFSTSHVLGYPREGEN